MIKPVPQLESKCHSGRSCVLQLRHSTINKLNKKKENRRSDFYPWISGSQLGPVDICLPLETLFVTAGGWCHWSLVDRGQGCCQPSYMAMTAIHNKDWPGPKCQACQDWAPRGQSRVRGAPRPSHRAQCPLEPWYSLHGAVRSHTYKLTFKATVGTWATVVSLGVSGETSASS